MVVAVVVVHAEVVGAAVENVGGCRMAVVGNVAAAAAAVAGAVGAVGGAEAVDCNVAAAAAEVHVDEEHCICCKTICVRSLD